MHSYAQDKQQHLLCLGKLPIDFTSVVFGKFLDENLIK